MGVRIKMKTSIKLIATLATASILAGCNATKPSSFVAPINNGNMGKFETKNSCSAGFPSMPEPGVLVFEEQKNKCGGAEQRNQIRSPKFSQNAKKKFVLSANVSFDARVPERGSYETIDGNNEYRLFQVADGGQCAPAATFRVYPQFAFTSTNSGFKPAKGSGVKTNEYGCVRAHGTKEMRTDGRTEFPTDGTPVDLKVEFEFKGKGAFRYVVYMDGKRIDAFNFERQADKTARDRERYHFNFGMYSHRMFDYTLIARNFRLDEVDTLSPEFYETGK